MPNLSMNPAVRYTTQSSAYDRLLVGRRLTDRRIAFYQQQGRYGQPRQPQRKLKKNTLADLLKSFG